MMAQPIYAAESRRDHIARMPGRRCLLRIQITIPAFHNPTTGNATIVTFKGHGVNFLQPIPVAAKDNAPRLRPVTGTLSCIANMHKSSINDISGRARKRIVHTRDLSFHLISLQSKPSLQRWEFLQSFWQMSPSQPLKQAKRSPRLQLFYSSRSSVKYFIWIITFSLRRHLNKLRNNILFSNPKEVVHYRVQY